MNHLLEKDKIAQLIALVAAAALLAILLGFLSEFADNPPWVTYSVVLLVGMLAIGAVVFAIINSFLESEEFAEQGQALREVIIERVEALDETIAFGRNAQANSLISNKSAVHSSAMLRRILGALELRKAFYVSCLKIGTRERLEAALEISNEPLRLENAPSIHLAGEEMPILDRVQWECTVKTLVSELAGDQEKDAA